jgi:hypothetical protein
MLGATLIAVDPADRLALHELAALYADAIDGRDWDGLANVFTDDIVYSNPTMPGRDLSGLGAVRLYMSRGRHPVAHHITNVRVGEGLDGPILHSTVLLVRDDGSCRSGEYHDRVVQTPNGWRIQHRSFQARVNRNPAGPESADP